jgi:transmembrane sensor
MTEKQIETLIDKYANEVASEEEVAQLIDWYHSFSENEVHYPGDKKDVYNRIKKRLQNQLKSEETKVVIFPWQKVAAALIILIGAGFLLLRNNDSSSNAMVTITNPAGQIKQLQLPDGSRLWLNAKTELRYKKTFASDREIELEGEAYFEVALHPEHPFVVKTGNLQTKVLGTRFTIKNYNEENLATIALISGSIQVAHKSEKPTLLKPTTQLSLNKSQQKLSVSTIDTSFVLAWTHGKLKFEGESLGSITNSLGRWYGVKFVFTDSLQKNCRYYMGFDNKSSLEKTIAAMAELTRMQYEIDNSIITVTGNGCQ